MTPSQRPAERSHQTATYPHRYNAAMATSSVAIRTRDLRKQFGPVTALDGVDLEIESGTILGVAGPNGSGKSTLIRCLLGLLAPTTGEVTVAGSTPTSFGSGHRQALGYMPQHTAVYDDLTVRENVAFFGRLYGVEDLDAAVDRALEFVDLRGRAQSRIDELSGGMIRRTSLACALVHEPTLLFLDEPTVGLDPALRASMWAGFRKQREAGGLVVVSTHYLEEATNCDRVLLLREGQVIAEDTPSEIQARAGTSDLEEAFLALLDRGAATDEVEP